MLVLCVAQVDGLSIMTECTGAPGETPLPPAAKPSPNKRMREADAGDGIQVLRACTGAPGERAACPTSAMPQMVHCDKDGLVRLCPKKTP